MIATKTDKLKTQKEQHHGMQRSPRRILRRAAAVLGHHRPGSEGNLASDIENQDQAVDDGQPAAAAASRKAPKREDAERRPREAKSRRPKPRLRGDASRRRGQVRAKPNRAPSRRPAEAPAAAADAKPSPTNRAAASSREMPRRMFDPAPRASAARPARTAAPRSTWWS